MEDFWHVKAAAHSWVICVPIAKRARTFVPMWVCRSTIPTRRVVARSLNPNYGPFEGGFGLNGDLLRHRSSQDITAGADVYHWSV